MFAVSILLVGFVALLALALLQDKIKTKIINFILFILQETTNKERVSDMKVNFTSATYKVKVNLNKLFSLLYSNTSW